MGLAAIVAYKGGGSMVHLTCLDFGLTLYTLCSYNDFDLFFFFFAFYSQHQSTGYCVILCFSLLSSRMVVCEVLIELHHGNHLMNSVVISL